MSALNQIAQHLEVEASRITRCEQWAKVWFVVIQGKGARFVSKKVVKEEIKPYEVKQLQDNQKGSTVWAIVTAKDGCFQVYKSKKAAEKAMSKLTPWFVEYWADSASGSMLYSIATGRYTVVDLTKKA